MDVPTREGKIILNFGWVGPSTSNGGWSNGGFDVRVVDLLFQNAKTEISVHIPENISSSQVRTFPFTCRRYPARETHPYSLKVTVEQIRGLTLRAGFIMESPNSGHIIMDTLGKITRQRRAMRKDSEIKLEVPDELEVDQIYRLVVTSKDCHSLSARLYKKKKVKDETKYHEEDEFRRRWRNMGRALINEGMQNIHQPKAFNTPAEAVAHVTQGVFRSGQQMHPGIKVPQTKPVESPSDLDKLTVEELQSRFEAIFIKDKQFESQRMQAALTGNLEEFNRITEAEHANSQLLINLAQALERKGMTPQFPQSHRFQAAAGESAELQAELLKAIEPNCHVQ